MEGHASHCATVGASKASVNQVRNAGCANDNGVDEAVVDERGTSSVLAETSVQ